MQRIGFLGSADRVVELEALEAGFDLDLGDGQAP